MTSCPRLHPELWEWRKQLKLLAAKLVRAAHDLDAFLQLLCMTYPDVDDTPRYIDHIMEATYDIDWYRAQASELRRVMSAAGCVGTPRVQ